MRPIHTDTNRNCNEAKVTSVYKQSGVNNNNLKQLIGPKTKSALDIVVTAASVLDTAGRSGTIPTIVNNRNIPLQTNTCNMISSPHA